MRQGNVLIARNDGLWRVTPAQDGGVHLVNEVQIDPGGSVPNWIINWFQTCGLSDALKKLHELSKG